MRNYIRDIIIKGSGLFALCILLAAGMALPVSAAEGDVAVALGEDLKPEERASVLEQLEITEEDLAGYTVVSVSNEEEHEYLGGYLDANVIGSRALSCVMVIAGEEGSGLEVTTKNISYCTIGMYRNALITAGVEDAEVIVAGPFPISGTAALIGVTKAYEAMTGTEVSKESLETASNELVLTGELAQSVGDSEKAEELMAAIKQAIAASGIESTEDVEALIKQVQEELDITLTEEDTAKIMALVEKLKSLDLDSDALKEQAQDIYNKIKDMDITITQDMKDSIGNFFTGILDKVLKLLGGFLG